MTTNPYVLTIREHAARERRERVRWTLLLIALMFASACSGALVALWGKRMIDLDADIHRLATYETECWVDY